MNDPIVDNYTARVEPHLLKAKRLLAGGLESATQDLKRAAGTATKAMSASATAKLRAIETIGEDSIDTIEKYLGRLNYLAAEGDIRSCAEFDQFAGPMSLALEESRTALAKLDDMTEHELDSAVGAVHRSWEELHLSLAAARLELELASKDAQQQDALRTALKERYEEASRLAKEKESKGLVDKIHEIVAYQRKHFGEGFRNLFGLPEPPSGEGRPPVQD